MPSTVGSIEVHTCANRCKARLFGGVVAWVATGDKQVRGRGVGTWDWDCSLLAQVGCCCLGVIMHSIVLIRWLGADRGAQIHRFCGNQ